MNEQAIQFGPRKALIGVFTPPERNAAARSTAVVLLNAGLISHVGPYRLYVRIARALSRFGFASARFDISGIGDSPARRDGLSIREVYETEPREVMDDLEQRGYTNFLLIGICSGADCALGHALIDQRVSGAVMLNPENYEAGEAWENQVQTDYYVNRSMKNPRAWINLFTGRVNYRRLATTLLKQLQGTFSGASNRAEAASKSMWTEIESLLNRGARLFYILSEHDVSTAHLDRLLGERRTHWEGTGALRIEVIEDSDHLFTRRSDQAEVIDLIANWCVDESNNAQAEQG